MSTQLAQVFECRHIPYLSKGILYVDDLALCIADCRKDSGWFCAGEFQMQ